ncbi:DNA repair protein [Aspergillus nomiae NRRL 13137]|uniref:Protein artemis n=1 Tax=Aspergillus nomiae NRRL (strain ATCC 15546 / NRRL 13137 / CBS 260.88 / M93) TaxID=1509407 RepID=A0A0L1IS73_ASPN3|nr:DNA repair protein [Aspergillus nomiae NRRL 13137]KNG82339.1 DNA repair protein [Aspergillus nomiae NRRL 13137]
MSTFDGIVHEFPYIQIDYFRKNPDRPPPLAGFLSHVHSDHLQGLESFRAPFIYCSVTTRELLLHIEKYPHPTDSAKHADDDRTYPSLSIRVTLLDANHCTGAVMFLIEGSGKSILYTGDVRAESWWVNSLIRHPVLIPYTLGGKRLDKIYLDSTFARHSSIYRTFPSKAKGLAELLQKVASYPEDTTFYFRAWTFGYEEVWMALSAALNSKIHVDRYQMGLYRSLVSAQKGTSEASALCGFELGNRFVPGCLSEDEECRIHGCEPGVQCSVMSSKKSVYIIPIVSRTNDGSEIPEIGAGGGGGDLYQIHELEIPNELALEQLEKLCLERIHDSQTLLETREALIEAFKSKSKALQLDSYGMKDDHDIPLENLVNILSRRRFHGKDWSNNNRGSTGRYDTLGNSLPTVIHFPYSRHSSYAELCELVSAFKPKDIYPCTVDPLTWDEDVSIQSLFGHLCSGTEFAHDHHMRDMLENDEDLRSRKRARYEEPTSQSSQLSSKLDSMARTPMDVSTSNPDDDTSLDRGAPDHTNSQPDTTSSQVETQPQPRPYKTHTTKSNILSSSYSSSDCIPIPSSLETIQDNNQAPRPTPEPTRATEKARRNEIRQAWHFLNNVRSDQTRFHLGSLPSSWSTEEDKEPDYPGKTTAIGETSHHVDEQSDSDLDTEIEVGITDNNIEEQEPEPESQFSSSLSISSSAFASQEQPLEPASDMGFDGVLDEHIETREQLLVQTTASLSADAQTANALKRSNSSSRVRRAAYLAAKADSYEAWASMGLVSAGDNHTEEEIEL